jgi:geranylgeranyl diphosphate synthase type I
MQYVRSRQDLIEDRLEEVLGRVEPETLGEELRHVALSGGKRVRPTVTLLACETAGGQPEDAIDFAVGIELVHDASLVVDDIIDRSDVRRANPSAWAAYGYGPAILASDGLLGEAFDLFSPDPRALETVSKALVELGEGEASELVDQPDSEAAYMELARRKTGALFRAAAQLGALAAEADDEVVEALGQYAERVGIAFQIRDDVLDATAEEGELGKPTGHDAEMDRPSLVQVTDLTVEEVNDRAHEQAEGALAALASVEAVDSRPGEYLRELAEFVVTREH